MAEALLWVTSGNCGNLDEVCVILTSLRKTMCFPCLCICVQGQPRGDTFSCAAENATGKMRNPYLKDTLNVDLMQLASHQHKEICRMAGGGEAEFQLVFQN